MNEEKRSTNGIKKFFRKIKHNIVYWYSFNKSKFSLYFSVIAMICITMFLDFKVGNEDKLVSHLDAMSRISSIMVAFYFFLMMFISIVIIPIAKSFIKKRSLNLAIIHTVLNVLLILFYILYINEFIKELNTDTNYSLSASAYNSFITLGIGCIFGIISTIVTWKNYDKNFKYEKEE